MNSSVFVGACVAALLALAGAAQAAETIATPGNLQGWTAANVRADGNVAITGAYARAGETGSLEFHTNTVVPNSGQDKADFTHAVSGTLGDLVHNAGAALSYDYYVNSSSTTNDNLAPAFRLAFFNADTGKSGYLVSEAVYNGHQSSVPMDQWVSDDILGGNFWMRTFGPGNTIEQFSVTLAQWASGTTFPNSYALSDSTIIYSVEVGVGSGWNNSFSGAVDHVNVDFGRTGTTGVATNFEVTAGGGVPEPASWALLILGFGGVGAALRGRRGKLAVTAA